MEKHSLWNTLSILLANLHSKFVKHGEYVVRDGQDNTLLVVKTRLPYAVREVKTDNGIILISITKGEVL